MKYVLGSTITLAVLVVGALLFAWSGIYNIAATKPHWGITLSFIEMFRDRSISVRSDGIDAADLDDAKLMEDAFIHYHEMCRLCHGAPDYQSEEFAKGLYPQPPNMITGSIQGERSEAEIYWILKHGIKMTGMPAFGPTHSDSELYGLVALTMEIPQRSPEEYRQQVRKMDSEGGGGHGHGSEPPAHGETEQGQH
jgi:mono/diheme cytochrome c family protein